MITITYNLETFSQFVRAKLQKSVQAKLQKRDRKGRFSKYGLPASKQVEKNPFATFYYPMSDQPWNSRKRYVRVISATPTHITGLEKLRNGKWQFKKFRQDRATGFCMESFNPASMS